MVAIDPILGILDITGAGSVFVVQDGTIPAISALGVMWLLAGMTGAAFLMIRRDQTRNAQTAGVSRPL